MIGKGDKVIDKDKFHVLNYVKKEEYTGSTEGMRYMLKKKTVGEDTFLEVIIWPEPYGYAKTPEQRKQRRDFTFNGDGLEEAVDWMNEQLVGQADLWNVEKVERKKGEYEINEGNKKNRYQVAGTHYSYYGDTGIASLSDIECFV